MSNTMKIGDLVQTPKVSHSAADMAVRHGLGTGYYDWEGKFGVVIGFDDECAVDGGPFIKILMQDTGKLCVFSPNVLTRVEK